MNNPRITKKEWGLIKGALRRVFSRSDLRREVIEGNIVHYYDPHRSRVKTWCLCAQCNKPEAKSNVVVDHKEPIIPIDSSFEEQGADATINRLWCDKNNLQVLDKKCHDEKSLDEARQRREHKNAKSGKADKKSSTKRVSRRVKRSIK